MKLIVGLGNPEKKYDNTRHNIGFEVINHYASLKGIDKFSTKFNSEYTIINANEKTILLKPQTYMNLSGVAVRQFVEYFDIEVKDILIIQDDMDLELGAYKLKQTGGAGGHNGIKNIIENLKSQNFNRLKIGISKSNKNDTKNYVLGKFKKTELELIKNNNKKYVEILDDFTTMDILELMNKHN